MIFGVLMVASLGVFFLFTVATTQNGTPFWLDILFQYSMIWIGLISALLASLFAYSMGLKRLHGYGLLILGLFVSGHFLSIPLQYLLLAVGSAIIASGVVLLARFMRRYLLPRGAQAHATQ
jgi:hypothetical protein